jgi:GNAT superfamily N-acetyltransferase
MYLMLVRPANVDDAEACARVMVRAMGASPDYNYPKPHEIFEHWLTRVSGYLAGTYHPGFSKGDRIAFVAEKSGEIIGFIAGHRTLRFACDGELQWAFVSPDYQHRGIATSLLSSLREWFVQHKIRKVCVNASENMDSRSFYIKHGAEPLNEHWVVWEDIGVKR